MNLWEFVLCRWFGLIILHVCSTFFDQWEFFWMCFISSTLESIPVKGRNFSNQHTFLAVNYGKCMDFVLKILKQKLRSSFRTLVAVNLMQSVMLGTIWFFVQSETFPTSLLFSPSVNVLQIASHITLWYFLPISTTCPSKCMHATLLGVWICNLFGIRVAITFHLTHSQL